MIRRVRTIVLLIAALLTGMSIMAGTDAGREVPFSLGTGGRALGMGGSFTALSHDATSVYYNAAGLAYLEYQEATFMHSLLLQGASYNYAAGVYPTSYRSGIGVGFMRLGTDEIPRYDNYILQGNFGYSFSQFVLSYGIRPVPQVGIGANVKILNQSLDNLSDYGVGMDLGVRGEISDHIALGFAARDLIPATLELNNISEEMPRSFSAGVALSDLAVSEYVELGAGFDLEKHQDRSIRVHAGAEMWYLNTLAVRIGYDRDNFTFGAGFNYKRLRIDYAFKLHQYVDAIHHFSLSVFIGPSVSEREERLRQASALPPELTPEEQHLLELRETGDRYFRQFELDSALTYYNQYYALDSTDEEVVSVIQAIEQAQRLQSEQDQELRAAQLDQQQYMRFLYARARLFYDQGNYTASLDLLSLVLDIDSANALALQLEGTVRTAMEEEIAARLDSAAVAEERGEVLVAIDHYSRILEIDPYNESVLTARREALASLDVPQQLNLGIRLFEQGRLNQARRRFEAVLNVKPDEPVAIEYLGRIDEMSRGDAEPVSLDDLQRDQETWQRYLNGLRFMRNGEYQNAINEWQAVLNKYPNQPQTLENINQARLRLEAE
jgi:tetratricopeptide (TPR) repeat protein